MTSDRGRIHVGTSGWSYPHWHGPFYPPDLDEDGELGYYAGRFSSVEINNSFYHLPERRTLEHWREHTPAGFVFAVKASRYVTHMKKLKDPQGPMGNFLERVRALDEKLGPVLLQLPPRWGFDEQRLADFLEALDTNRRYAFELRDPSWLDDRAYALLEAHGAAFCIYDLAGRQSPKEVTADFVYVRLHGPGDAYQGSYDAQALSGWAGAFATWSAQGRDVYCYFDNDEAGYAALNAARLRQMTG